ncbi:hypothetical protein 2050HW_00323 [Serratia phage vB_SmaM_ 2050HW]|uniref:Uncharacterized protein n=1 Tax=Serratia phage vB_SmaM_ 2050HW TaxID=2024252 RepID=A0A289ZUB4_9CAUD|nr:hypothetical protein HWB23_gp323 [Serratia phage vB_SmaM_ 2050HW]ATA65658.1 hypothetical protein 2050HW_00323 [Serratia phage vB_SmaM_ 2050HW]URG14159.1 hypothetical protein [Pectobacterium phage vB_ParM-25]
MKPQVIDAIFFESSNYDDQFSRSFDTHFDGDVSNDLLRNTSNGRNLSPTALSRSVGSAITMQSRHRGEIVIPGGWGEKRLSFIITVLIDDYNGRSRRQVLTGYTDYNGVSRVSGSLDDEMLLYVNNSTTIADTVFSTGRGNTRRSRIESNDYIIRPNALRNDRTRRLGFDEPERLLRPNDIFNNRSIAEQTRFLGGSDEIIDTRGDLGNEIKLGRRTDNNASNYLSRVLRAGIMAETNTQPEFNVESRFAAEELTPAEHAAAATMPNDIGSNTLFMEFLASCDFGVSGSITLREFADCTDWDERATRFIDAGEVGKRGYTGYERGRGSDWKGSDRKTIAASIIAQSVPALMMQHFISDAIIKITNDTLTGEMKALVEGPRAMIPGMDVTPYLTPLEDLLVLQVGEVVSHNNQMLIDVQIDCSVITDIKITISIEGDEDEEFVAPCFCDGLTSPMKTPDYDQAAKIGNDLSAIIDDVVDQMRAETDEPTRDYFDRDGY